MDVVTCCVLTSLPVGLSDNVLCAVLPCGVLCIGKVRQLQMQVLLGPERLGCRAPALVGLPGTLWIGGTTSQEDSKHRQLKAPAPDGRSKPPHAVRITTAAVLPKDPSYRIFRNSYAVKLLCSRQY